MVCKGTILNKIVIGYYSCTLMYANQHGDKDLGSTYREKLTYGSVKEFHTYDVFIRDDLRVSQGRTRQAWIILPHFNLVNFTNDHQILGGSRTLRIS